MANLLIILGAAAALAGLSWLAYVGSIMKGSRGNAIVGGISAAVVGGAVIVLGTSISDGSNQGQEFIPNGAVFNTPTPQADPTPTVEVDPGEAYRAVANDLAARAGVDLSRVIQLLSKSNPDSPIWINDVRQTSTQFARYSARAQELIAPPGHVDIQEKLTGVLADLAIAGRLVIESLDANALRNIPAAQAALTESIEILTRSSDVITEIVDSTAG